MNMHGLHEALSFVFFWRGSSPDILSMALEKSGKSSRTLASRGENNDRRRRKGRVAELNHGVKPRNLMSCVLQSHLR